MKYDYIELMAQNPTQLNGELLINSRGQSIDFYEHPIDGDESPVIAVCHDEELAYDTDFYDLEDFYEGSDYNPVLTDLEILCEYEFND